ncbi:hypothetical protein [Thiolapillus sp.]|uniref:hypothetical protein n=1 Tax=Thiolapillus sp. TaxID=2017437 RepID=UPI003AF7D623
MLLQDPSDEPASVLRKRIAAEKAEQAAKAKAKKTTAKGHRKMAKKKSAKRVA